MSSSYYDMSWQNPAPARQSSWDQAPPSRSGGAPSGMGSILVLRRLAYSLTGADSLEMAFSPHFEGKSTPPI